MNKIIIYCILLLVYLILSKSLSPSEFGISYINEEKNLDKLIPGAPVTAILVDVHSTGFLIKTYYLKYKIVYGFQSYEELIVRTSRGFKEKNLPYLGLSLFRRYKDSEKVDYTPLPPGSIFIGDKNFGNWKLHNSGEKVWKFFRVYRQIPNYLGWSDEFLPTLDFKSKAQVYMSQNRPFTGPNEEFGIKGPITQKAFPQYFTRSKKKVMTWKMFLKNYFNENFINYKEQL